MRDEIAGDARACWGAYVRTRRIRWGVIGAGGIADRRAIAEGILPSRISKLAAVMDTDAQKAAVLSEKYGVPATTCLDELLDRADVDAVYIATPHYLHAQQIVQAASAGKHVLCEKPMAGSATEAHEVSAVVRRYGVKLGMAFMFRYHPVHLKMRELLESGAIGRPVAGRAQLSCWLPRAAGSWYQIAEKGLGGTVIDMASHCMDLLEWFFGRSTRVAAFVSTLVQDYAVDDMSTILQTFSCGAHGIVDCYWNVPDGACENRLEIYGTKGSMSSTGTIGQRPDGEAIVIRADQAAYEPRQERDTGFERKEYRPEPKSTFLGEFDSFASAIIEDREPDFPAEQAVWNVRLCDAVYRSAQTGRVIELEAT